jgi:hypothetical protein
MAEISNFFSGDLANALDQAMEWMLARLNANVSPLVGNAVFTPTSPPLVEGAVNTTNAYYSNFAQEPWPNIVLDPIFALPPDEQAGPDGFPINYSNAPLLSGSLLVNVIPLSKTSDISGRVFNLVDAPSQYRVDVYSRTDVYYYQGSSAIAADNTWQVRSVRPGTVMAFLMPATSPRPSQGFATPSVTGWTAHSNLGVGNRLEDYFVRVYVKTDTEYLQEDNIPILVQDSRHARYGTSNVVAAGTPVAHVIYNDPVWGPVDLYSSLQNLAVYSDLPRSIEVPPGDPDFVSPSVLTGSNVASIQNRCWIYDAALAIIALSVAGLWEAAARIVTRLNALQADRGYLPSLILEDAEDGSTARWTLASGAGNAANVFDPSEPPPASGGSKVISFTATTPPAAWSFTGLAFPDFTDSILDWRYKTAIAHKFVVGVTSSTGKVTKVEFVSSGSAGYNAGAKTITVVMGLVADAWRVINQDVEELIAQYVAGETLTSLVSFQVVLQAAGNMRLDNLSAGAPQPEGSLSFSYDVYNGQIDQAYIRTGAMAWVCYAYGIYIERTGDFHRAALALESMLKFLFTLQYTGSGARHNLFTGGWGRYQDPGYQYVPGQLTWVSTEHNVDCYFAFEKAAKILPSAALNLLNRGGITSAQYSSLVATAATASTKASEIKNAILDQLWIPASGGVKGHFAQGASESGLDTSLALDAAGTWAAMFCHEAGASAQGVECLEFIYEQFLLTNCQILKSSQPNSFNEAYEQLTPFDGFKPYADSPGGYSGSPEAVWMEGTWGALAAYLRFYDNTDLETYFAAHYPGGLEALLAQLVQSMKIAGSTTGQCGLLAFSLAARALPWELSVRKAIASTAWFWITATRNDVLFATTSDALFGRPYLKIPRGTQQVIQQLEGQGSIGALELESTNGSGYMTALASAGKLEGRKVTLKVGYPGMASSDFITLATQQVESVQVLPDSTGYLLQCRDLKRSAKTKVFTQGDDGSCISKDHPHTLLANPMDCVLMVFQNELGLGQVPFLPESSWKLYEPSQWDLAATSNPTLIDPNPYVDVDQFLSYRNGIFAGTLMEFEFQQPVEAKQFLEYEIFRALGGYLLVLPDGRLSPRFFVPPYTFLNLFEFNERNMTVLPGVERQPIINQVTFRMDYDGSQFQTEFLFLSAPSLERYDFAGQHIIESKGLKTARGGVSLAALSATRIFRRYAGLDPVTGTPNGGAVILTVTTHFRCLTVEVGDYVFVSHPLLPNFETGRRGVFNRLFEVIEKQPNYSEGSMTYRLLDAAWVRSKKLSRVAPLGTPSYPSASTAQRARYMFIAQDSTQAYSDGTPAKTIF